MTQPTQHPDGNCCPLTALVAELARRLEAQALVLAKVSEIVAEGYEARGLPLPAWLQSAVPEQPGVIDAETRRSDEETLLALAERLWPHHEYLDLYADGGES